MVILVKKVPPYLKWDNKDKSDDVSEIQVFHQAAEKLKGEFIFNKAGLITGFLNNMNSALNGIKTCIDFY